MSKGSLLALSLNVESFTNFLIGKIIDMTVPLIIWVSEMIYMLIV